MKKTKTTIPVLTKPEHQCPSRAPWIMAAIIAAALAAYAINYSSNIRKEAGLPLVVVECQSCGKPMRQESAVSVMRIPYYHYMGNETNRFFCAKHVPVCDFIRANALDQDEYFSNPKPYQVNADGTTIPKDERYNAVRYIDKTFYSTNVIHEPGPTVHITNTMPCGKWHLEPEPFRWSTNITLTNIDLIIQAFTNATLTASNIIW